ncbi:hypothetical protein HYPSUDRAFT_207087 [Hypholoma sublateritium FD-334 SS-4]|uniref:Uncharacterized protein n=1 Tax=Hypholoma sublateritium (strain FD-334 SS-4) TaxID=945553 RepID=A0A0D2LZN4_HYPSF|nr:hypothetical protein HYPSUDRAFT_207087 [Hypholoma sublateritium FD-334 SS-4]
MSHRITAVEMVFGDIPSADLENEHGDFVLVNLIKHGLRRWEVGQFLLSITDPKRREDGNAYLPVVTFTEGTGVLGAGKYICEDLIRPLPNPRLKENTLVLPGASGIRPLSSLEFVWVVDRQRRLGDPQAHKYRPAMFINYVSDTESMVMMLDKANKETKRKNTVRTASIQRYDRPEGVP